MKTTPIPKPFDRRKARQALAALDMPQWHTARAAGISPSQLSGYLTGALRCSDKHREALEAALSLRPGALVAKAVHP